VTSGTTIERPARRLGADERREQLLQIGLAVLHELPFDQLTADTVAQRAGVSKGLVFHYFPTNRDLHVAVLRAATTQLVTSLDVDPDATPGERLRLGVAAFVAYIERQPSSYRAISRGAGSDVQLVEVFEETRASVVGIIERAAGFDRLPPGLLLAARGWIALVEESVLHWLDHGGDAGDLRRDDLVDFLHRAALTLLADPIAVSGLSLLPGAVPRVPDPGGAPG
jgi:AcrR family transcriptional regulator